MYSKGLILLSCFAFMASCTKVATPSKSGHSTNNEAVNRAEVVETTELTAREDGNRNGNIGWNEIVDNAEKNDTYHSIDELNNEFVAISGDILKGSSPLHVSSAKDYNPLIDRDYIYLNLDNLAKEFHYPVDGKLTSNYGIRSGRMHTGVDLKAPRGYNVYAVFDGVVRMAKYYSAYGNLVVVRHYNGLETVYAHNSKNLVKVGDIVQSGDVIAKVGRTGRATTDHVHFEVRVAGQYLNPNNLLDVQNNCLQKGDYYLYKKGTRIYSSNTRPSIVPASEVTTKEKPKVEEKYHTEAKKPKEAKKTETKAVYHTIVRGNTLGALARKYGTTVSKICSLNKNLTPRTTLRLKQRIRVK